MDPSLMDQCLNFQHIRIPIIGIQQVEGPNGKLPNTRRQPIESYLRCQNPADLGKSSYTRNIFHHFGNQSIRID